MIAVMNSANSLGSNPAKSAANGPIKVQNQDATKLKQKDPAQQDRSEYEQALSEVSGADESQSNREASSAKDEGSSEDKTGADNEQASTDPTAVTGVIQPGIVQPSVCGAKASSAEAPLNGLSVQRSAAKFGSDPQAGQAQPVEILSSFNKHRAQGAEGSVTKQSQGHFRSHAEIKTAAIKTDTVKSNVLRSAVVKAGGDTTNSTDSAAAVKAAMASVTPTTVKNSMPLTLEGVLASAHQVKHSLDVTSLRAEQQVSDVASVERLLSQPTPVKHEWSMVKLDSQQQSWSRQLCNVLQDRIEMQINQHIKQAKIRLDPPDLGRLDLTVRFEGDRLSVVVHSSNASVREALQDSLADLRGGLADQFGAGVDVNVGGDSSSKQFKESENSVALHSVEEQEIIEHLPAQTSGWLNALA